MYFSLSKKDRFDFCWQHLFDSYKKYVRPDSIVLEIGASTVSKTGDLSNYCKKVIGIEKYDALMPQSFGNVEYLLADWQDLKNSIQADSIDIAVSSHTIEHVQDDLKAIDQLYFVLKPGGVALINTPNKLRLGNFMQRLFPFMQKYPYEEHVREYALSDLNNLLNKTLFRGSFRIMPVAFGIQSSFLYLYTMGVPRALRNFCTFWEIHLFKNNKNKR